MVYKYFDKKSEGGVANNEIKQNEQLAEEFHKPIINIFLKKESIFIIKRQSLGYWFSWYAINKPV